MTTSAFFVSDEHNLFQDSVDKYLQQRYSFSQRLQYATAPDGWSREVWADFAELGLTGYWLPADYGGYGAPPLAMSSVMEALGKALVLEPVLPTAILGAGCIALAARPEQCAALLPSVAQGKLLLALAHAEEHARYDLKAVRCSAVRQGAHWLLNGEKFMVLGAPAADRLIASARIDGGEMALFLVDPRAAGVRIVPYITQDGHQAGNVTFDGVRVDAQDRLDACEDAAAVIEQVVERAVAALCAEGVGVMARMLDLTVDYLGTRKQFGVKIGSFQVLQHRAVDMLVALDQARSMTLGAFAALERGRPDERRRMVAAAKAQVGRSARFVGQSAIQLHGGIGVTMEYMVGHCFLRSSTIEVLFGDAEHHLARLASWGGLVGPALAGEPANV